MNDSLTIFLVLYGLLIVFCLAMIKLSIYLSKSKYRRKPSTSYNKSKIRGSRTYVSSYSTCDLDLDSHNHTYASHNNYINDVYIDVYTNDNSYNAVEDMLNFPNKSGPFYDPHENQLCDHCTGGWLNEEL